MEYERKTSHFDQPSQHFKQYTKGRNFFQGVDDPPVDPYIRAGIKPDLVAHKRSIWKRLVTLFNV